MRLTALWCLWILAGWTPFDLESRLYFVHIPKTAGTTLRTLLEMQVSAEEIYPYRNRKTAKAPVVQELVSGHLPYWLCKDLDPDFEAAFKVTILRDPVERYLSFLRAKKFQNPEFPNLESVMRERDSPVSKYNSGLIDNAHCRHLAANPLLEGRELLESAKESLRRIDCVIFFDRFADDVAALFQRLGISLERQDIPRVNFTQKEPVSEELLKEIRQINLLDLELYQYAKTHLQMKRNGYRLRTKSFDSLLTKTTEVDYRFDQPLNGKWWSYRESTGEHVGVYSTYRWVMNQPAIIYFSLEAGRDYNLSFTAQPLKPEVIPRVRVNGVEFEIFKKNGAPFSLYCGKIPRDCIGEAPVEIQFYSSESFLYRDVYPEKMNRNYPPVSFAVSRIHISEIPIFSVERLCPF